jgi:hypothetical protein
VPQRVPWIKAGPSRVVGLPSAVEGREVKRRSAKTQQREDEARPIRDALKELVGRCEVCLLSRMPDDLAGHEIANGNGLRLKCLDKPYGLLIVCRYPNFRRQTDCHGIVQNEKEAKQLARLYMVRPSSFDLVAYNNLVNPRAPNRITFDEVMDEVRKLTELARS